MSFSDNSQKVLDNALNQCVYCGKGLSSQKSIRCKECGQNVCTECNSFGYCRRDYEKLTPDVQNQYLKRY